MKLDRGALGLQRPRGPRYHAIRTLIKPLLRLALFIADEHIRTTPCSRTGEWGTGAG